LSFIIPKGFIPRQDNGLIMGGLFQLMQQKMTQALEILRQDPVVESVSGSTGGGQPNTCFIFAALKPLSERNVSAEQVMNSWREKLSEVSVAGHWFAAWPEISIGAHWSQFQYILRGDDVVEISHWATKVEAALREVPALADVNLDQQQRGLRAELIIDRRTPARLGISISQIDNPLYDAFGQRQVSTIYAARNQYHVVMEVAPEFWQSPEILSQIYVSTGGGPVSGTQATQPLDGTVFTKAPAQHSGSKTATTTPIAEDRARNQANNAIANSGRRSTSTGAAVSTSPETMIPLSVIADFGAGTRRSRLVTEIYPSPRQFRSILRQTSLSARRQLRSRIRSASLACLPRSVAGSRVLPRSFSNRSPTSRI
jgi:multidrug efflux pump